MKDNRLGHLVQFRYRGSVLYGVILKSMTDEEGNRTWMIQAGDHIIHGVHDEDLSRDYGGEK